MRIVVLPEFEDYEKTWVKYHNLCIVFPVNLSDTTACEIVARVPI
jgi:hypothetical protein